MMSFKNTKNSESLWLDNSNKKNNTIKLAFKVLQSDKFQSKLVNLVQHFDNSNNLLLTDNNSNNHRKVNHHNISNPISFNHVSHLDNSSSFGLENSFANINSSTLNNYIPLNNNTENNTNNSIDDKSNQIDEKIQEAVFELDNKIKAISTYRTNPTPLNGNNNSSTNTNHQRSNSFISLNNNNNNSINQCSSQISTNSTFTNNYNPILNNQFDNRMSYSSDISTVTNCSKNSNYYKLKILPCIPQDSIVETNDIRNDINNDINNDKFNKIPSAPPPPPTTITPEDRLKSLLKQNEEIEIASDDEDDELNEFELTKLKKFRLSLNIESITNKIDLQFSNNNNDNKKKNKSNLLKNKKYRDSIMTLWQNEIRSEILNNVNESEISEDLESTEIIDTDFKLPDQTNNLIINEEEEEEEEEGEIAHSVISDFFADLNLQIEDLSLSDNDENIF